MASQPPNREARRKRMLRGTHMVRAREWAATHKIIKVHKPPSQRSGLDSTGAKQPKGKVLSPGADENVVRKKVLLGK